MKHSIEKHKKLAEKLKTDLEIKKMKLDRLRTRLTNLQATVEKAEEDLEFYLSQIQQAVVKGKGGFDRTLLLPLTSSNKKRKPIKNQLHHVLLSEELRFNKAEKKLIIQFLDGRLSGKRIFSIVRDDFL